MTTLDGWQAARAGRVCAFLLALATLMLAGCGQGGAEAERDAGERGGELAAATGADSQPERSADDLRLVTLAPGLTQMLVDLDLADRIVGVAEHDAPAPAGLPVVGNYADVHTERLLELSPTHVLTLTTTREPPRRLRDLAAAGQFELVAYPFPTDIEAVRRTLHHDAGGPGAGAAGSASSAGSEPPPLGELLGIPERARQLSDDLAARLEQLRSLTAERDRPEVLMIIGTNPIMASGPGTVHDELLTYLGARNAARDAGLTAPTYDREALLALAPDVILLLSPGAPPLGEEDPRLAPLHGLPIPALEEGRVHLVNHPLTLLASTSLPDVAALMGEAIHPDLIDNIARWREGSSE